jgi:hypothetical protein
MGEEYPITVTFDDGDEETHTVQTYTDDSTQLHVKSRPPAAAEADAEMVEASSSQRPPPAVGTRVRKQFDDGEWQGNRQTTPATTCFCFSPIQLETTQRLKTPLMTQRVIPSRPLGMVWWHGERGGDG